MKRFHYHLSPWFAWGIVGFLAIIVAVLIWGYYETAVLQTNPLTEIPGVTVTADTASFTAAGLVSGVATNTRNTTASATDPNSYFTNDMDNSIRSKFQSQLHLAILKSNVSGRYLAKINYMDNGISYRLSGTTLVPTGGYSVINGTSSVFSWRRDARGNINGLHTVVYYGMVMVTVDIQPGTNPITNAATNVFTLKASNYTGRYVYAYRTGYFNPDSTTVTYRP